ncbi:MULTISPECIES: MFS transporter [Acinetobacter]|nr:MULTISPECIES: MFS transporter [Acinetobacter]EXC28641.1 sugar (and other) transporter family protein [Acinetobacter sp. 809848]MBN6522197.1 MFS transporter [Acinetobacter pittii]MBN6538778.1 MFS transporter [Acinetobacter pittii]MCG6036250.1 MFS transporter [Acinetobacter baumannii]MCH2051831.1 MFS transporter [Acinetobacter pittii]
MHRQVLILAGSQAIFQSISVLIMTIGGLAGALLTPNASLITVPISMASLGTVLVMFPASLWMSRVGRKAGFITGTLSGVVAAIISIVAMIQHSFMLLCLGMLFLGIYQAFAQFYRFAAAEIAPPVFRTKAISLVLAGGVIAALLGPFLASIGSTLLSVAYMGSFLFMGILASLGLLLLSRLQIPMQSNDLTEQVLSRPWIKVISQPAYLVALFSGASGFGIMVLGLTATPIAMKHYGFDLSQIAAVIQLHILGRFIPSFFTAKLIDRFGVIKIMLVGILLLIAYIIVVLSGVTWGFFAAALILMGIGWNFLYIGGTSLLATTYSTGEKGVAQAANDMSVFIFSVICSLGAGPLLNLFGWKTMHLILVPWIICLAVPMLWLTWNQKFTIRLMQK